MSLQFNKTYKKYNYQQTVKRQISQYLKNFSTYFF